MEHVLAVLVGIVALCVGAAGIYIILAFPGPILFTICVVGAPLSCIGLAWVLGVKILSLFERKE